MLQNVSPDRQQDILKPVWLKKLEELGIGRPSTYAPTISTIQNRGYVVKEEREGKQREFTCSCAKK